MKTLSKKQALNNLNKIMKKKKEKVFMVCDWDDGKARGAAFDIGIEYMGNCKGRILKEDGTEIGRHHSSTYGWLRKDLIQKLDNPDNYDIIDFIEKEVPEQFRLSQDEITHYFK